MPHFDKNIKQETEDVLKKLNQLRDNAVDYRQHTVYKAQIRKFCNRVEKALHLVKDAQTIIGE